MLSVHGSSKCLGLIGLRQCSCDCRFPALAQTPRTREDLSSNEQNEWSGENLPVMNMPSGEVESPRRRVASGESLFEVKVSAAKVAPLIQGDR